VDFLEEAIKYAKEKGVMVFVYEAHKEYKIEPPR